MRAPLIHRKFLSIGVLAALVLASSEAHVDRAIGSPMDPVAVPAPVATTTEPTAIATAAIPSGADTLSSPTAIAQLDSRLADVDRQLADMKRELTTLAPRRLAAASRAKVRGRRLYQMIRAGLMPLSGGYDAFVEHAQRVERLKHAIGADLLEGDRLQKRAAEIGRSVDALGKERATLADKKGLVEAARVAIDEERRRREAFERAFANSVGGKDKADDSGSVVVYGGSGRSGGSDGVAFGSFKSRKGRLAFPVAGEAEARPASFDGGPGLSIKAPLGATVRATHAGRVAFADRYGTYGQLVILDHGDRCYTVSGNLGSVEVHVGDEIAEGEKIGTVGNSSGDGKGPALYFEIRIDNDKVAPSAWLGL